MTKRRRILWRSVMLLATVVLVLGGWEVYRRSQISPVSVSALAADTTPSTPARRAFDPVEFEKTLSDGNRFAAFIDDIRANVQAVDSRDKQLEHIESQVAKELDGKGRQTAAERHVERIWYQNGQKYRQTVEQIDLMKGKPKRGSTTAPRLDTGKINEVFPFTRDAAQDDYVYRFAGLEKLGDVWTAKILIEPGTVTAGRFQGEAWIDPETANPIRLYVSLAEKKPFLDQFSMLLDYGPAETGEIQVLRTIIDGSGGFAMLQKHVRSEIEMRQYQPPAEKIADPSNGR